MSPVAILPGRIRFEDRRLNGASGLCRVLEERLCASPGVIGASASHRTGRVLVTFDETLLERHDLLVLARTIVDGGKEESPASVCRQPIRKGEGVFSGDFLLDVALHMLLPSPLDFLLPAAASLRR